MLTPHKEFFSLSFSEILSVKVTKGDSAGAVDIGCAGCVGCDDGGEGGGCVGSGVGSAAIRLKEAL